MAYVVEEHAADGVRVIECRSKAEAHRIGQDLRRQGREAYAWPASSPWRAVKGGAS